MQLLSVVMGSFSRVRWQRVFVVVIAAEGQTVVLALRGFTSMDSMFYRDRTL